MTEHLNDPLSELDDLLALRTDDDEPAAIVPEKRELFEIPSGKYKGLVLPRMIGVKPTYWDRVRALREEIEADPDCPRTAGGLAQTYAALRRETEQRAAELSDLKLRLTAVMLMMLDGMEREGETAVTLRGGDRVRWQPEPHLIVTDKEEFRQWCLKNGFERDMVLPWGTANKHVKEMLVNGEATPPGAECFMRQKVIFSKGEK